MAQPNEEEGPPSQPTEQEQDQEQPKVRKNAPALWRLGKTKTLYFKSPPSPEDLSGDSSERARFSSFPRRKRLSLVEGSSSSGESLEPGQRLLSLFERPSSSIHEENMSKLRKATSEFEIADKSPENRILVKIESHEPAGGGEVSREKMTVEVFPSTKVRELIQKACKRFCKFEDYRYGLYHEKSDTWVLHEYIWDVKLIANDVFQLRVKNAQFFEVESEMYLKATKGNFLSMLPLKRSPFDKKLKRGATYLSFLLFDKEGNILTNSHHQLPSTLICKEDSESVPLSCDSEDFFWILKQSLDWQSELTTSNNAEDTKIDMAYMHASPFQRLFLDAVRKGKAGLSLKRMGHLFEEPVYISELDVHLVISIAYISSPELYLETLLNKKVLLKWRPAQSLDPVLKSQNTIIWDKFMHIHESMRNRLDGGLYLGLFFCENTPRCTKILVPTEYRQMCPVMKLRNESLLSNEEWELLSEKCKPATRDEPIEETIRRATAGQQLSPTLEKFLEQFQSGVNRLKKQTGVDWTLGNMFNRRLIQVDDENTIRMIAFVKVIGMEDDRVSYNSSLYSFYPLELFQSVHQHVYKPASLKDFRRRSSMLETDIKTTTIAIRSQRPDQSLSLEFASMLRENEKSLLEERQRWKASSWVATLMEWHRESRAILFRSLGAPAPP